MINTVNYFYFNLIQVVGLLYYFNIMDKWHTKFKRQFDKWQISLCSKLEQVILVTYILIL